MTLRERIRQLGQLFKPKATKEEVDELWKAIDEISFIIGALSEAVKTLAEGRTFVVNTKHSTEVH